MTFSDRRRRTLLRSMFLAIGVLPIVATIVWAAVLRTDAYRASWQQGLSAGLGLRVTLGDVRHPRPGVVLLEDLRGYDPETDALIVECRAVEAETFVDGRHIRAEQPTIYADRGAKLFAALQRRLCRETPEAELSVTFAAAELTWRTAVDSQTLVDVRGLAGPVDGAEQLLVNFRLPGTDAEHPASLRIARQIDGPTPTTTVELDAGAVILPCGLFAPLTEAAVALGPRARFGGRLKVRHTGDGWDGVVTGDVHEADLDVLVSSRFPHLLSGTAELQIHRAELNRGRLERGQMTILAGPGQIGRSLAAAGGTYLGLGSASDPLPNDSMLLFDRLACDVMIDGGELSIRARSPERPGAILWKGDLTYWREPPTAAQPAANLLRALVPFQELQVPAALQTAALMQWLPLAKPAPQPNVEPAVPPTSPKLRVRD